MMHVDYSQRLSPFLMRYSLTVTDKTPQQTNQTNETAIHRWRHDASLFHLLLLQYTLTTPPHKHSFLSLPPLASSMTVTIQTTDFLNLSLPFFGRLGREGGGRSSPLRAFRSATGVAVVPILAPALELL
jgi:hypothetical protein